MDSSLTALPLFVALFLGFASMTQSHDELPYCKDKICPKFVYQNYGMKKNYEERKYEASVWICTDVWGTSPFAAIAANTQLRDFRNQESDRLGDENMRLDTWPVLISVKGTGDDQEYALCWLVHPKVDATLLQPSKTVRVEKFPEVNMFVRHFFGMPDFHLGQSKAHELKKYLDEAKESVDNNIFYATGYNYMTDPEHNNEIWYPKKK